MGIDGSLQAVLASAASFFVVISIISIIILLCRYTKTPTHPIRRIRKRPRARTRAVQEPELSISIGESQSFDPSVSLISMEELKTVTKNFSTDLIIGDGSFGLVYKATLSSGLTVAIKKLDRDAFQGFREFRAEMETLGKLGHPNIVKILGYCISGQDRVLIYEFIERGSLYQWIHDASSEGSADVSVSEQLEKPVPLTWETRMSIVRGIANGLAYLHGLDTPIIHRDIKASNVLLDKGFEAHIADFGLARWIDGSHSHVSTQVAGTMGYMPPEYKDGVTVATVKADVYSFGILMIEIATGNRPHWPMLLDGKEVGLAYWARKMVEEGEQMKMVDPNVEREELDEIKVKEYFRIACRCTSDISRDRPTMREVVDLLNQNWYVKLDISASFVEE